LAVNRRSKYDELTEVAQDAVSGIVVVRAFLLYDVLNKRINDIAEGILKNEYARNRIQAISYAIENLMKWLPNIICTLFALAEVLSGNLSMGELVAFQVLLTKIVTPIGELPFRINDAREMSVSMKRVNDLLDAPKETGGTQLPEEDYKGQNTIALENVSYWYDANPDRKVLDTLNVSFEKGKITAIVGSSGAGKSTLFKILCGFEAPKQGRYLFMGKPFGDLDLDAARAQIGIVTQNVFLFPDTIAENVSYGNGTASNGLIEDSCKAACIHDHIKSLPEGYDTLVGEHGAKMSGGEKQRISIARALLKNAPILLMDEPTSALDAGTESAIASVFTAEGLKKSKTIVIIAHRLSTVINADKILVMDRGKVVETGTHQELIDMDGIYANLYKKEGIQQEVCYEV
ncbi:MAG: ABC transporter ATP-binding protein/permease, partial [Lachnospiraceae bacterium]|nr:ABC transporter ATP-binding protein/permease [Lachnospiraceae bacterium]